MTDLALRMPLAAGGAALEATGNAIHWGIARYMRAPLGNTGVLALVTLTALAGANALYFQEQHHPAPLFAPAMAGSVSEPVPVVPAERRPVSIPALDSAPEVVTGSVTPQAVATPAAPVEPALGNAEVLEIQTKLHEMQLYTGALDGLYGSRTAAAIRAFESANGLRPKGELTRELLEAVRGAPVAPAPSATVAATPAASVAVASTDTTFRPQADQPAVVADLAPLPTPAPLQQTLSRPESLADAATVDPVPEPEAESVETIISGIQSVAMTTPGDPPAETLVDAAPAPAAAVVAAAEVTGSVATEDDTSQGPIPFLNTDASPEEVSPFSANDPQTIAKVQRGLGSLGFLHGPADGVFGEATAKAIRNFEVYYSYGVTGQITPELIDLLVRYGASI